MIVLDYFLASPEMRSERTFGNSPAKCRSVVNVHAFIAAAPIFEGHSLALALECA
jgi:hypothetical protein